jgi:hypothetical protein
MLQFLLSLRAALPSLPDAALVSFATISDVLTVYDLAKSVSYVLSDLSDIALPTQRLPKLCHVRERFSGLLDTLARSPASASARGQCLGSALEAAGVVLRRTGGIVVLAAQGLPTFGRLGLKPRAAPPNGSETPLLHLPHDQPQSQHYRDVAKRLNRRWISVHHYAFSARQSPDIAVTGIPLGGCGGYGKLYSAENLGELHGDLFANLTAAYHIACCLQLRASQRAKVARCYGNFTMHGKGRVISFPVLGVRDSFTAELGIAERIKEKEIYVQAAFLWSTPDLKRMLRVFTFAIPVTSSIAAIHRAVDEVALLSILAKRAATGVLAVGSADTAFRLKKCVQELLRRGVSTPALFHLTHALAVSPLLAVVHPGGPDGRILDALALRVATPVDVLLRLYPRMFCVDADQGPLPLISDSFTCGTVFLFHLVDRVIVWVSAQASDTYLAAAFGVATLGELPLELPTLESPENESLRNMHEKCCEFSGKYLPLRLIGQSDPREAVLGRMLVDSSPINPMESLDVWMRELQHV